MFVFIATLFSRVKGDGGSKEIVVKSEHGDAVHLLVVGDLTNKDSTPVICFPGANPALKDEWLPIASKLAESCYVSVIVYTHKIRRPTAELLPLIHKTVLTDTLQSQRVIIMGKSAGGALAQEFAIRYPRNVAALVLAAPASSVPDNVHRICPSNKNHAHLPFFLAWANDDPSYSKSALWRDVCHEKAFEFYKAEKGGHRVLPEYTDPIVEFFRSHHVCSCCH